MTLLGIIPSLLGMWSDLEEFAVAGNKQLTGSIPTEFLGLSKLEYFRVENCNLTGTIPPFQQNFTRFSVYNNRFVGKGKK